ncbi:hypothetical protein [Aquabacter cavernae]|uniref:hypothetical protein n=1 Tax=Aquabacter cavernae TaxID=2496029 RepID=UPI000F8C4AC3|nr:hypothetical protein [Aquabacter cavernae]
MSMRLPGKAARCVLIALAQAAPLAPAFAQAGNDSRPPEAPGPTIPSTRPGETLSDSLNRTDGVIPPPRDTDPAMTRPAPPVGTTPVLPPPDTQQTPK